MNERGAHFWPKAMFTGGVFGSQHSQHSQQPYSGQYSQQRDVGLQQPAVPAAVGSSFFGLQYSELPCSGQQPTVVTAKVVSSFPGQHSEQRFAHFDFGQQPLHEQEEYNDLRLPQSPHEQGPQGLPHEQEAHNSPLGQHDQYSDQPCSGQQLTVVTAAAAYSFELGQQPPSDGELQEQPAGFGQPTVATATAASSFRQQHSEQPCFSQPTATAATAMEGFCGLQRLDGSCGQLRTASDRSLRRRCHRNASRRRDVMTASCRSSSRKGSSSMPTDALKLDCRRRRRRTRPRYANRLPESKQREADAGHKHTGRAPRKRRMCKRIGCGNQAVRGGDPDFCTAHGGGKRCQQEGCTQGALGATGFCIAHGGGRRCQQEGCTTGARSATDNCIAHGERCRALRFHTDGTSEPCFRAGLLDTVSGLYLCAEHKCLGLVAELGP
jgi:hypothetical protein